MVLAVDDNDWPVFREAILAQMAALLIDFARSCHLVKLKKKKRGVKKPKVATQLDKNTHHVSTLNYFPAMSNNTLKRQAHRLRSLLKFRSIADWSCSDKCPRRPIIKRSSSVNNFRRFLKALSSPPRSNLEWAYPIGMFGTGNHRHDAMSYASVEVPFV